MSDERPEQMPTLDIVKLAFYAAEETRHEAVPRVGDRVDVMIRVERPDGSIFWDETLFVEGLTEKPGDCGNGAAEIELVLERAEGEV